MNKDGSDYAVLWSFSTNGAYPWGSLVEASDGELYGTTSVGGTNSGGTLFSLQKSGAGFSVLHHFGLFTDGRAPTGPLREASDGALYGTTATGGTNGGGTVFTLQRGGLGYRVLHSFPSTPDDGSLLGDGDGGLIEGIDGSLYGTTYGNGPPGTAFKLNTDGTGYEVIYRFTNTSDGTFPRAALVLGDDNAVYGTTTGGGGFGGGTIFRIGLLPTPLTIRRQPLSQTVSAGSNVTFRVLAAALSRR